MNREAILDSKGDIFLKGRRISESEARSLIDALARQARKNGARGSRYLDIPPPMPPEIDRNIQKLVERLDAYSKIKGIDFWAMGLSREKQAREGAASP